MKIAVLNGSPKGKTSITMQYIAFLEKSFPNDEFRYIHAAQRCSAFEKNPALLDEVLEEIAAADLVLWAFPLYFLLVHSQYKRFIELIFERNKTDIFNGKHAAAISTSIHFFDNTAQNYIREICGDLGMAFLGSFPAHMHDLMDEGKRTDFINFFNRLHNHHSMYALDLLDEPKVTIVADLDKNNHTLQNMVRRMKNNFPNAQMMDLRSIKMGPCLGCVKCGLDNHCAYEGKDDYIEEHRGKVLPADILIFAAPITDRYLSSYWQRYLERSFYKTHQPTIKGKQTAFLISGPLSNNPNIREILTGYIETNGAHLVGILTDESNNTDEINKAIDMLSADLRYCAGNNVRKPLSFLGTAGKIIFRDEIYGDLRFIFQQDHKYLRKHREYNFPQKKVLRRIVISLLVLLTKIPKMREQVRLRSKTQMIKPYRKVLQAVEPQN